MALDFEGGLGGAASGAKLGSAFGPIGTFAGAVGGAIVGAVTGKKKNRRKKRLNRIKKELSTYAGFRNRFALARNMLVNQQMIDIGTAMSGISGASSVSKGAQAGLLASTNEELKSNSVMFNKTGQAQKLASKISRDEIFGQALLAGSDGLSKAFGSRKLPDPGGYAGTGQKLPDVISDKDMKIDWSKVRF